MKLDYDTDQKLIRYFNQGILDARTASEIQGIAAAIVYDEKVDEGEVAMLAGWMERHRAQAHAWPLCDLFNVFEQITADGQIDDRERLVLLNFLSAISCSAERSGTAADNIFDEPAAIEFPSRAFVFTGKLESGPRKKAQATVVELGGLCHNTVRIDTNFLVVGALGTDYWKTSRYGTKIEEVMHHRSASGATTRIVREIDFSRAAVAERLG